MLHWRSGDPCYWVAEHWKKSKFDKKGDTEFDSWYCDFKCMPYKRLDMLFWSSEAKSRNTELGVVGIYMIIEDL